jgi:endonuclease/exonuclease/phosphatase family metal-dependent hydrolase
MVPSHGKPSTLTRRSLFGGIAAGAVAAATGMPGTAAATAEEPSTKHFRLLRFATYNIHHAASMDNVFDMERIARKIEDMDVDVIGLQEVDRFWARSEYIDQPAWFADRLGMEAVFGANYLLGPEEPGRPSREYGTAILSKWPIRDWDNTHLPRLDDHEQRGLLRAEINIQGARVDFYNTHLQHDNDPERELQARAVVDLVGQRPRRAIMTGDFNTPPGTAAYQIIQESFWDSWDLAGDGPGYTYHADEPTVRIDYVFTGRGLDVIPLTAEVVADDPESSDHRPVLIDSWVRKGQH